MSHTLLLHQWPISPGECQLILSSFGFQFLVSTSRRRQWPSAQQAAVHGAEEQCWEKRGPATTLKPATGFNIVAYGGIALLTHWAQIARV